MKDFTKYCLKNEAIYHCPDKIKNFKICVTFNGETTRYFNWQQKIFSNFERDFYKDEKNCITDLEHKYHNEVVRLNGGDGVLFSYTDEDRFIPTGDDRWLSKEIITQSDNNSLFCYGCQIMYIMADLGEYADDVWIKNEYVLCTIKYNEEQKILSMYPDFTITNPYILEINEETTKTFTYTIENACETIDEVALEREEELLQKLLAEKARLHSEIIGDHFEQPLANTIVIHLFFELSSARNFENPNIYIRYLIDLPENFTCEDQSVLTGTTQTSKNSPHHFGFCFDVTLQIKENFDDFETYQRLPYIYFEVISKDTWSRFRTEGLAYQCLPVFKAGYWEFQLNCVRICPRGIIGELRRFFIGDCGSCADISWIGLPVHHEDNLINKYGVKTIPTGELSVKLNVIYQRHSVESPKHDLSLEKFQSSSLLRSVADVLRAFRKARKNMIETRKNV